jgi:hypothetical protein
MPDQMLQGQLHLDGYQPQQQEQQQLELHAHSALQLVGASTYLLVAAASSGCCEVVAAVMQYMQVGLRWVSKHTEKAYLAEHMQMG